MTSEELTGVLQSRGQEEGVSYYVISEKRYNVPQYVLDYVNKMKNPIQNGEAVGFTRATDDLGRERVTKIWRQKKEGTAKPAEPAKKAPPPPQLHHVKVIKVNEIAFQYDNLSKDPKMAGKRLIMMTPAKFGMFTDAGIKEGDEIDILIDAQGVVTLPTTEFKTAKDIHLQENLDRLDGPADGETIEPPGGELIKAPGTPPEKATVKPQGKPDTTPEKDRAYRWDLTIGGTINLQNYENLKVEISGPACDREQMKAFIGETLDLFGMGNPATREQIEGYKRRVL